MEKFNLIRKNIQGKNQYFLIVFRDYSDEDEQAYHGKDLNYDVLYEVEAIKDIYGLDNFQGEKNIRENFTERKRLRKELMNFDSGKVDEFISTRKEIEDINKKNKLNRKRYRELSKRLGLHKSLKSKF